MRVRFSLRTLMLVVVIAGLIGTAVVLQKKSERLAAENGRLKEELGHLKIVDPGKIHVRELSDFAALTWRWRLYVPERPKEKSHYHFLFSDSRRQERDFDLLIPMESGHESLVQLEIAETETFFEINWRVGQASGSSRYAVKPELRLVAYQTKDRDQKISVQREYAADETVDLAKIRNGGLKLPQELQFKIVLLTQEQAEERSNRFKK